DHCDVGGAAADVHDHVSMRFSDRQSGADRCRHRFLDEIDLRSFGAISRVFNSTSLDLSYLRWNTNHDARAHPRFAVVGLANEVLQHLFGDFEVRNDSVFHGPNGNDVAGSTAQHIFRIASDSFDLIGYFINRNDGGFRHDDAASLCINECICRPEVNSKIAGKQTKDRFERHLDLFTSRGCIEWNFGWGSAVNSVSSESNHRSLPPLDAQTRPKS